MDASLCFSTLPILRCASFTRLQVILLFVPTALEVFFATSLVVLNWNTRHLWITAEGWIYFSLALIEMLSHILPAVRDRADVFKIFDTFLSAASFIPIFCYTFFIFLLAKSEFVDLLPHRLQMMSKLLLIIFIPAIIALNELASFIGISRSVTTIGNTSTIALGFASDKDKTIWTFLTSLSLALLTAYQAINFCFAFYRLIKAILNQRRIETSASDEAQFLRGIGWITGGLKLGAIETVIGFAANGFGSAMTRRVMRLLARACLFIGLIRGMDTTEDFTNLERELSSGKQNFRRSRLRNFISNPRHSTFRQLSPAATAFHSTPRAPSALAFSSSPPRLDSETGLAGMDHFAKIKGGRRIISEKPARERVTVHFDHGTPSLHMRFSALEVPEFPIPPLDPNVATAEWPRAERSPRRATFHAGANHRLSLINALGLSRRASHTDSQANPVSVHSQGLSNEPNLSLKSKGFDASHNPGTMSSASIPTSTVQQLTSQFPSLQPASPDNFWDDSASISSHASTARPGSPPARPSDSDINAAPFEDSTPRVTVQASDTTPSLVPDTIGETPSSSMSAYLPISSDHQDSYLDLESALGSAKPRKRPYSTGSFNDEMEWISRSATPSPGLSAPLPTVIEETREELSRTLSRHSRQSGSMGDLRISWLQNPGDEPQLARAVSLRSHMARIKSFGRAPIRSTPQPVRGASHMNPRQGSLHIENIYIPPKDDAFSDVEIIQGSMGSAYSRTVLRDSDVLGMEDVIY